MSWTVVHRIQNKIVVRRSCANGLHQVDRIVIRRSKPFSIYASGRPSRARIAITILRYCSNLSKPLCFEIDKPEIHGAVTSVTRSLHGPLTEKDDTHIQQLIYRIAVIGMWLFFFCFAVSTMRVMIERRLQGGPLIEMDNFLSQECSITRRVPRTVFEKSLMLFGRALPSEDGIEED